MIFGTYVQLGVAVLEGLMRHKRARAGMGPNSLAKTVGHYGIRLRGGETESGATMEFHDFIRDEMSA